MKKHKKRPSALEIVYSNRYCIKIEADYARLRYGSVCAGDWEKLYYKCIGFLEANVGIKHPTVEKNVETVRTIKNLVFGIL